MSEKAGKFRVKKNYTFFHYPKEPRRAMAEGGKEINLKYESVQGQHWKLEPLDDEAKKMLGDVYMNAEGRNPYSVKEKKTAEDIEQPTHRMIESPVQKTGKRRGRPKKNK